MYQRKITYLVDWHLVTCSLRGTYVVTSLLLRIFSGGEKVLEIAEMFCVDVLLSEKYAFKTSGFSLLKLSSLRKKNQEQENTKSKIKHHCSLKIIYKTTAFQNTIPDFSFWLETRAFLSPEVLPETEMVFLFPLSRGTSQKEHCFLILFLSLSFSSFHFLNYFFLVSFYFLSFSKMPYVL